MGVANLTMMATQAVAVAVRAVGASHQKSCGDPNQQVGAIITNITGIHLISHHRQPWAERNFVTCMWT